MSNSNPNPATRLQVGHPAIRTPEIVAKHRQTHTKNREFLTALNAAVNARPGVLILLADKLLDCGLEGEGWALTMIAERLDGKVPQPQVLTGDRDNPISVSINLG